jgi:hypothetical protein
VANNTPRGGRNVGELYGKTLVADGRSNPKNNYMGSDAIEAIGRPKRDIKSVTPANSGDNISTPRNPKNNSNGEMPSNPRNNSNGEIKNPGSNGELPSNPRTTKDTSTTPKNNVPSNPRNTKGEDYTPKSNGEMPSNPRPTKSNDYTPKSNNNPRDNYNGSGTIYGEFSNGWYNTSAISSITILGGSNIGQYSSFALYGIKG